jgi:uncharacterized protein with FMN-binding domain
MIFRNRKIRNLIALVSIMFGSYECSIYQEMIELPLEQPDLSVLDDGTFPGVYKNHRWFCHVSVSVENQRIDTIEVLRAANGGKKLYEQLVTRVIDQQTVEVDAVSGATISSNTFLKAVENALAGRSGQACIYISPTR